jgi:hypothetical protein
MTNLPTVTLVCIDTVNHGKAMEAIHKTLKHIQPAEVLFFSDVMYMDQAWRCIVIDRLKSTQEYSHFVVKELNQFISTKHLLIIQHDGYVIDGTAWTNEFLDYDYIGAPWLYKDGRNVGNGGFSLRSKWLHNALASDTEIKMYHPEDEAICRLYRQYLQVTHGIRFAPEELAHKFSSELHRPTCSTFGFHGKFHSPYREPIILRRSGAMGDVIMMEPVMASLHEQGYRVVMDVPLEYFNLFLQHHYPVEHINNIHEDANGWRVVNLDMAYESVPKLNVIQAYAKACGVLDGFKPRNPRLNYSGTMPLFDRYVVMHVDDTGVPHRNVHGVDWDSVARHMEDMGWMVLRVGHGNGYGGTKVNTHNEHMLAWIIAGAKYFIGIDSGCSHIAVATGVPAMIFFGSVAPGLRYLDLSKITIVKNLCPVGKDACYHEQISTVGQACVVDPYKPPCIGHTTQSIKDRIENFIL